MTLLRPKFNEGQVLSAGDLGRGVDYARYADAVHGRTQHTWGVVIGLGFRTADQTTSDGKKYKDVYLTPGIAIDPSGRRVVVDAEQLLSTVQFNTDGVAGANEPDALYPVYVSGIDQAQASQSVGVCASGSPTRIAEAFQVSFGRPGSESNVLQPPAIGFAAGPSSGLPVLVGYVAWDPGLAGGKFIGTNTASTTGAVRYAGVRAGEVLAPAGSIVLHTQETGKRFALSLAETAEGGCTLQFGSRQDDGKISDTFKVDDKGNVTFSGTMNAKLPTTAVAASGVIFHGLRVPLPPNVTEDAVTEGKFATHVVLSPIPLGLQAGFYPIQLECSVDDQRRVASTVMWRDLANTTSRITPAACQYLIVASPSAGGSP